MRRSCGISENELPNSRKLHAALCNIPTFLKYFGPVDKADTSSWESVHRSMTVGVWELTSKRHQSMIEEMVNQCIHLNYTSTCDLITAITSPSIDEYVHKKGPTQSPEYVVIEPVKNYPSFDLSIDENDLLTCTSHDLTSILNGSSLTVIKLTELVKHKFGPSAWQSIKNVENPIHICII